MFSVSNNNGLATETKKKKEKKNAFCEPDERPSVLGTWIRGKLIKRVEEVTGKRDDGAVSNLPQFPESNDPGQLAGGRCYYITREQPTRRVRV